LLARRDARLRTSPFFLRGGFRLFFLGGSAWAVIALGLWMLAFTAAISLPTAFTPLGWHRHEMLFGFVGAIVAGFLLAAIPNWTSRPPIGGFPIAGLFALWTAGRLAVLFSSETGAVLAAIIDVLFYLCLAIVAAGEIIAARNRNLPVAALVLLLALADALDHLGGVGSVDPLLGARASIALIVMMISLIGGRIIPAFTRNWLSKRGPTDRLPPVRTVFDALAIGVTAAACFIWVLFPQGTIPGASLVVAGLLQAARLSRWGGLRTVRDPLVFVLHVGYAWLPAGLLLLGGSLLAAPINGSVAIHALTAGAMASMILAVMTRASLGHTGRPLAASTATRAVYVLVIVGGLLRVFASTDVIPYLTGIELAALFWGGAFLTFILAYGPMLLGPRVDGRDY
jgi:uncharacterized protein involved in response to NO